MSLRKVTKKLNKIIIVLTKKIYKELLKYDDNSNFT